MTSGSSAGGFDLVVRHGMLVIPGIGSVSADVGITGGRIVALGEELSGPARETLDARGKVVLPGIFDPHVHIGNERSFEEEAETETRAAVLGGVTTIGIFLRSLEDSYYDHLPAFRRAMDERSYVDSVFHPQLFTEQQIAELPGYAEKFGIRSFKFYMSGMPGIVKSVTDEVLLGGLSPGGFPRTGCDRVRALRDRSVDRCGAQRSQAPQTRGNAGRLGRGASCGSGGAGDPDRGLPGKARRRSSLCRAPVEPAGTRCRARLSPRGCSFHGRDHQPVSRDSSDDPNGFLAKMVPPVRTAEHGAALWEGLRDGTIQTVGTDNTSRGRKSKQPQAGLHGSRPGLPVLGTHLPALLHFGRLRGVALETLVDRATRAPARVYGIYPQKGTIAVGSDADLVVVDLDAERVVRAEDLQGFSDFSPFEGKTLRGWPVATVKGGKIVARDGKIVGPPTGRYIPRWAPKGQEQPRRHK